MGYKGFDFGNAFKYCQEQHNGNGVSCVAQAVGSYLPEKVMTNKELEELVGFKKHGIKSGMIEMIYGVKERRYAALDQQASDLAAYAAQEALCKAGIAADDIDMLIFSAVTQDVAEPATAHIVQDKIGAKNAQAFDINNACNAFLNGIDMVDCLIRCGKVETALVVSGEVMSRYIKLKFDDADDLKKRMSTLSLGDGGTAMVFCAQKDTTRGVRSTHFHSWGHMWPHNVLWGGGSMYPRDPEKFYIPGDTKEIIGLGMVTSANFFNESINAVQWAADELDLVAPHQLATLISETLCKRVGIGIEKTVLNMIKYGNTGAASIPMALYVAEKEGKIGKHSKICLVGGAVGFSFGCVNLVW